MTELQELELCKRVADAINKERGWTHPENVGVLPAAVYQVIHYGGTASHPMTQRISAEIRRQKEKKTKANKKHDTTKKPNR